MARVTDKVYVGLSKDEKKALYELSVKERLSMSVIIYRWIRSNLDEITKTEENSNN